MFDIPAASGSVEVQQLSDLFLKLTLWEVSVNKSNDSENGAERSIWVGNWWENESVWLNKEAVRSQLAVRRAAREGD